MNTLDEFSNVRKIFDKVFANYQ